MLFVNSGVVRAVRKLLFCLPHFRWIFRNVRVDPAIGEFFLQLRAGFHHFVCTSDGETGSDRVKVPSFTMVGLDQSLAFAVKIFRSDHIIRRCEAVYAGQSGNGAHPPAFGLGKEFFGRDGTACRKRLASGSSSGKKVVKEVLGGFAGVITVNVFDFLRKNPYLQPIEKLLSVSPKHADLREVDMTIDESRYNNPVLYVSDRLVRIFRR